MRPRGRFRRLTALVGRGESLKKAEQQINSWLKQSYAPATFDITTGAAQIKGRNRLLVVGGAAAVGKSRFAYELVERMKAESAINTAYAHCVENASLSAFAAEVAQVAGLTEGNLPARWEVLCSHAAGVISEAYAERQRKHLPLLALLLDCEEVDTAGIRQADTGSFLLGAKLALRACCELIAHFTGQPVVLVIEDLQWMGSLREVITDLLENACLPQPLIAIGTARPEFAATDEELAELTGIGEDGLSKGLHPFSVMELPPLERTEGGRLVQKLLPGIRLPGQVERELAQKAEGLPYYYEEFARLLLRRGLVVEREGRFEVKEGVSEVELPEDIRALILDRLNGLEPELRELTGRAAVIGRSFSRKRLQELEKRLGVGAAEELESGLANLAEQQVLGGEPGDRYFFEHVMSRDAAYNSVPNPDRLLLHGVMSDVLTEMLVPGTASDWDILPELAHHLVAAGRFKEAHKMLCELLRLKAWTGLYDDWSEWEARARHAWGLAREQDTALPEQSLPLLMAIGELQLHKSNLADGKELCDLVMSLSRELEDSRAEMWALSRMGYILQDQGKMDEARACRERHLAKSQETGNRRQEGGALLELGIVHYRLGDLREALACYERSLDIQRELGHRLNEIVALAEIGLVHQDQGRMDKARQYDERALRIASELGNRNAEMYARGALAGVNMDQGRLDEAIEVYEERAAMGREEGNPGGVGTNLGSLGALYRFQGRMDEARECLMESLRILREVGFRRDECEALRELGILHSCQGRHKQARECLDQALGISRELRNRRKEAWALIWLAELDCQAGDAAHARARLQAASEILTGLSDKLGFGHLHCTWVSYHLTMGRKEEPEAEKTAYEQGEDPIAAAWGALAKAERIAEELNVKPASELCQRIVKARAAIEEYEKKRRSRGHKAEAE